MSVPEIEIPSINAVIFDMDGLMFNTEDLYDIVLDQMLRRRGLQFSRELKHKMMGLPGRKAFHVMQTECDLSDTVEVLGAECEADFLELLPDNIQLMPGLESVLEYIETLGLPKAIATSSHRDFAKRALACFDLEPRFKFILTGDDVQHGKPNPDIYLEACSRIGSEPASTLVLEDSLNGSLAAAAAGALLVVVPTHHSDHLSFDHADFRVKRLDDPVVFKILDRASSI